MSYDQSKEIAKELAQANIKVEAYKRSPVAGAGFILNRPHNQLLRVWANDGAEVEITKSKRHRQATLTVEEPERTLTRDNTEYVGVSNKMIEEYYTGELMNEIRSAVRMRNPLRIPGGRASTKINVSGEELRREAKKVLASIDNLGERGTNLFEVGIRVPVTHKMKAPAQTFNLLCGIDEVAHFICALPEKPKSVAHAHELLRPKEVKKGTLRQGEFFFKKVSKGTLRQIERHIRRGANGFRDGLRDVIRARYLERDSSHFATCSVYLPDKNNKKRKLYVSGQVMDTRASRHAPLNLDGWYEVIRNREVRMPRAASSSRTEYWD